MAEARILYIATEQGLYQLANPGKSDRWREVGRALGGQVVRAVAAAPDDPLLVFAASDKGISRSVNGGLSWEEVSAEPAKSLAVAQGGTSYAITDAGKLVRSLDGAAWEELSVETPLVGCVVAPDGRVLAFGEHAVYAREPADAGWQTVLYAPELRVIGLALSTGVSGSSVFVVGEATAGTRSPFADPPTGALVLLGGSQPTLLLGTRGALLRGEGGWETQPDVATLNPELAKAVVFGIERPQAMLAEVVGPRHVTALVTPPRYVDQVFAGTGEGVLWFSSDRGRTWAELRAGLPPVQAIAFTRAL